MSGTEDMGAAGRVARAAYEAYGDHVRWLTYLGRPMPPWEELPLRTQCAWAAATGAAVREAGRQRPADFER